MDGKALASYPVHPGRAGCAVEQPLFTGDLPWYESYEVRHGADGADGRLLAFHHFSVSWTSWEMHPAGAELVVCTAGAMTIIQELSDGTLHHIALRSGDYAINLPGTWHTADVDGQATALFITTGEGTRHRPR